jgi:hypothetical protein
MAEQGAVNSKVPGSNPGWSAEGDKMHSTRRSVNLYKELTARIVEEGNVPCEQAPDMFFIDKDDHMGPEKIRVAKDLCALCPLSTLCLEYALEAANKMESGVDSPVTNVKLSQEGGSKLVQDFIEKVLGSASGNAFISRASGKTNSGKLNINIHKTFLYPQQLKEMVEYAEQYASEDVYLSPLLYGDKRNDKGNIARTPENALTSQTIYMDSDLCVPEKFRLMPSIHVATSKGRGHDYWVLDKPVDAKRAAEIAHKITTAHREDGCDPSGWSANKVLRLPNTVNTGHGFPESVLAEISDVVYTITEIENAYEDIDVYERPIMGRVTDVVEIVEPNDLPDYTDSLNKLPAEVLELALQEPRWARRATVQSCGTSFCVSCSD